MAYLNSQLPLEQQFAMHRCKTAQLKANALTLERHVIDPWTKNPTNAVYFDNVVIARRYIGPVAKP